MILAGTGHRPQSLGGFDADVEQRMYKLAHKLLRQLDNPVIISGMALGWDQELCSAALALGYETWAYVPFIGQESRWTESKQDFYHHLLSKCSKVVVCSHGTYGAWKMEVRNQKMVDDATQVLALWNGSPGGTGNCVAYANKVGKPVLNLWEYWESGKSPIVEQLSVYSKL